MKLVRLMTFNQFMLQAIDKSLLFYQNYFSPLLTASCRFEPTCSQYARDAIRKYGVLKGGFMTMWRILRCHPYSRGGHDPVR